MPFYTWLRPARRDSKTKLADKARAVERLMALRKALKEHISGSGDGEPREDDSKRLRLATWNIREFDSNNHGKRLRESRSYIAEILSHFDLIAVQEVKKDLTALEKVMTLLGPEWDYFATDAGGNTERMVFIFNKTKVRFRNVAGELTLSGKSKIKDPFGTRIAVEGGAKLTLPGGQTLPASDPYLKNRGGKLKSAQSLPLPAGTALELPAQSALWFKKNAAVDFNADGSIKLPGGATPHLSKEALVRLPDDAVVGESLQFARSPYLVSFQAGWLKLNLCTVHIFFGDDDDGGPKMARRVEEIERLTDALSKRAKDDSDSDADAFMIALGDFNIVGKSHKTMAALERNKFEIPKQIQEIPKGTNVKRDKYYDQIAVWRGESKRRKSYTRLEVVRAGVFDFFEHVFREEDEAVYKPKMKKPKKPNEFYKNYKTWRTHQMSDHLPMWVELRTDFGDIYLEEVHKKIMSRLQPEEPNPS